MSRRAVVPPLVAKEIRALVIPWAGCLVALGLSGVPGVPLLAVSFAPTVYIVSAVALGAMSLGHEYTHRTLNLMLTVPASRPRVLLTKLGVLAAMLATMAAVAEVAAFREFPVVRPSLLAMLVLAPLGGLLLAPWMTMIGRSSLAGTVFTMGLPGAIVVGVLAIRATFLDGQPVRGINPENQGDMQLSLLWAIGLGLCAFGAVAGWRRFMRLQVTAAAGAELYVPIRLGARQRRLAGVRRTGPVLSLIAKELGLQQMALVVVGLYLAGWGVAAALVGRYPHSLDAYSVLSVFYGGLLGMLIGAFANAERDLGTHAWQLLLPVSASRQWAMKAGVALVVAALFGVALPVLLAYPLPLPAGSPGLVPRSVLLMIVMLLTTVSLYLSSLGVTGLWAFLVSFPTLMATGWLFGDPLRRLARVMQVVWSALYEALVSVGVQPCALWPGHGDQGGWLRGLFVAGAVALLLRFGAANHRTVEPAVGRAIMQFSWVVGYLVIWAAVFSGVDTIAPACR